MDKPSLPRRAVRRARWEGRKLHRRVERAWLDLSPPPVPAFVRCARVRVLLYSPGDLNLVDGSSIWVQSVVATLLSDPDVSITLPLRRPERRDVITGALRRTERLEIIPSTAAGRPDRYGVQPAKLLDLVERLDRDRHFDAIILRSFALTWLAVERHSIRSRLWSTYVVEPERDLDDASHVAQLGRIARGSRWLVAQSEPMRELTERVVPESRGRVLLLPPGISGLAGPRVDPRNPVRRLFYVGKLHPFYSIPAVLDAFTALRAQDNGLELHVIGDKVDGGPLGPDWAAQVDHRLRTTPGVKWVGAIPREDVGRRLASGGIAISAWDYRYGSRMNDLVVSTKLLDYAAVGIPTVLNRTESQIAILGADYPLFIDGPDELARVLARALADPVVYAAAAERAYEAARRFTYPALYQQIAPALRGESPAAAGQSED